MVLTSRPHTGKHCVACTCARRSRRVRARTAGGRSGLYNGVEWRWRWRWRELMTAGPEPYLASDGCLEHCSSPLHISPPPNTPARMMYAMNDLNIDDPSSADFVLNRIAFLLFLSCYTLMVFSWSVERCVVWSVWCVAWSAVWRYAFGELDASYGPMDELGIVSSVLNMVNTPHPTAPHRTTSGLTYIMSLLPYNQTTVRGASRRRW